MSRIHHSVFFIAVFFLSPCAEFSLPHSDSSFSYQNYKTVLKTYVDGKGFVDYRGLKNNSGELDAFLSLLANIESENYQSWTVPDKIAFWLNAYNALTLKTIIEHYPIKSSFFKSLTFPKNSIRQISGVWDKIMFSVIGEEMTLDHIEHQILRKEFIEPRIHTALVCAAKSCPPLRNEPYNGENLNSQLEDQTKKFLFSQKNFLIDNKKHTIYLSSIFEWFGEDFLAGYSSQDEFKIRNPEENAVLNFISLHIPANLKKFLWDPSYRIKYMKYDWNLNEKVN